MDLEAHWQALYDEMRDALDGSGYSAVPIYHVDSTNDQTGEPAEPPLIVYRDETLRPMGTMGNGNSTLLKSGFLITTRAYTLGDALSYESAIITALDAADSTMTTTDGYYTTNISILGALTLFEPDSKLYARHLRIEWERSL